MGLKNVVGMESLETRRRHLALENLVDEKSKEIKKGYVGEIRRFVEYCQATGQPDNVKAMLDYLYVSIVDLKAKKTTWELRLVSIRRHLVVTHGVNFESYPEVPTTLKALRELFKEEEHAEQILLQGKSAIDKPELIEAINELEVREKAICLINLVTASRPSEMVRLKVKHFDLEARSVRIYLKKQSTWHDKRLTQQAVKAVRDYIRKYKLKQDDYFVGRFNFRKSGKYESVQISEVGYTKALQRWTGLTAYNFRKTQVLAMHIAGADLPTIAKQTGHKSIETIANHYLTVSDPTVDKYL